MPIKLSALTERFFGSKYKNECFLLIQRIINDFGGNKMAKYEKVLSGDFDTVLSRIQDGIINGSATATLEDSSDFFSNGARCSVRVFERYSYTGNNRVSMSVTLFQSGDEGIHLSAITSGGSQAMLFKVNTFGEEAFLDKLIELL